MILEEMMEKTEALGADGEVLVNKRVFKVADKAMAIRLRWVVIILCSYLLLYSGVASSTSFIKIHSFILLYILSNIELYFVDEKLFEVSYFYAPLVLLDAFFLASSLLVSSAAA